jgi:ribonucleoside-triphosphate reductase
MSYSTGLFDEFIEQYSQKQVPWGECGYVTYKRTYSRLIPELGRTEEWHETCARVCNGLVEIGGLFTQAELEELYDHLFHLRGSTSGRALWQLGTETIQKVGADSLQNCWHVTCNSLDAFCFAFNQLMLGGGVGFNILPEYVYELGRVVHNPIIERVETPDCDFIVADNREGWVKLLRRILYAFFIHGRPLRYNTSMIRAAGKRINSFGGVASGSEPLVKGIDQIIKILRARFGQKLRPIDCMDIMNLIGTIVVSGNVRRSSEIAIGDPHDLLFVRGKNWSIGSVPNWRASSNNTVACDSIDELLPDFWEGYYGRGEPYGLLNLTNFRRFGRLADGEDYRPDYGVVGCNPCAEIGLDNKEPCNLADIFLPNIRGVQEFKRVAYLLYKVCKTVTNCDFSDRETDAIVKANRRIGIGLTGYMAAPQFHDPAILTEVYRYIEEADRFYSSELGVPCSVKLTTMKPSGTLSLLPRNCPPGMHAAYDRYLIRRIRFAASDPIVEKARQGGYHVEPKIELDGSHDTGTMVVSFPMKFEKNVVTAGEMNVIQELEVQKHLQTYWADNSVSATHYFKPEEIDDIKVWLKENYTDSVKACSFLLHQGHGFVQAPLEPVSREQYETLKEKVKPIERFVDERETDLIDNMECGSGGCPVK